MPLYLILPCVCVCVCRKKGICMNNVLSRRIYLVFAMPLAPMPNQWKIQANVILSIYVYLYGEMPVGHFTLMHVLCVFHKPYHMCYVV